MLRSSGGKKKKKVLVERHSRQRENHEDPK